METWRAITVSTRRWRGFDMKTKTFDCLRMKREGAERIRKELEGKTLQEQLDSWQKGTEELRDLQHKLKNAKERST
jgi:hypothetical protein